MISQVSTGLSGQTDQGTRWDGSEIAVGHAEYVCGR